MPAESYEFANKKMGWETIPPLLDRASPLRSSHLRDPVGPNLSNPRANGLPAVEAANPAWLEGTRGVGWRAATFLASFLDHYRSDRGHHCARQGAVKGGQL